MIKQQNEASIKRQQDTVNLNKDPEDQDLMENLELAHRETGVERDAHNKDLELLGEELEQQKQDKSLEKL